MNCKEIQCLLPFIGDGSLDPNTEIMIRKHLVTCNGCRKEYDEITAVLSLVSSTYSRPPREIGDMAPSVLVRVEREKIRRKKVHWAYSAAAVIMMAVGIYLYTVYGRVEPTNTLSEKSLINALVVYEAERYFDTYDLVELAQYNDAFSIDNFSGEPSDYKHIDFSMEEVIDILAADNTNTLQ